MAVVRMKWWRALSMNGETLGQQSSRTSLSGKYIALPAVLGLDLVLPESRQTSRRKRSWANLADGETGRRGTALTRESPPFPWTDRGAGCHVECSQRSRAELNGTSSIGMTILLTRRLAISGWQIRRL